MPAPNDVEITRVYTREVGGSIADVQFPFNDDYEVVIEAEAGSAIAGSGLPFQIGVTVRNLTDSTVTPHNVIQNGTITNATWPGGVHQAIFGPFTPIPGAAQIGVHTYEAIGFLTARAADPDVSVAKSPLFLVHSP